MNRYLIDANLPRRIAQWQGERFLHVVELGDEWTDTQIWEFARQNDHAIVTKDADFSHRIIVSIAPPKVIHLRVGNMRLHKICKEKLERY